MFTLIKSYLFDEDGQSSTEYILLVAVVAMIVFRFRTVAVKRLNSLVNNVFDKADDFLIDIEG